MRTFLGGTVIAKRNTNRSCPTPPTRSSLRPKMTFERGIRRHGHYHREHLAQVLHGRSPRSRAIAARMRRAEQRRHLKAQWDGYSDGLCRTCAPHAPAHRAVCRDPLSSASSPFPYLYIEVAMVML